MSIENELRAFESFSCPRLHNLIHELKECKNILMRAVVHTKDKEAIDEVAEIVKEMLILREKLERFVKKAFQKRKKLEKRLWRRALDD